MANLKALLRKHGACEEAREWAKLDTAPTSRTSGEEK